MKVSEALASRCAVRAFLPDPVPTAALNRILDAARRSPSGGNLQPWLVHVVTGGALDRLISQVSSRLDAGERVETSEYRVYPMGLREPYRSRRHAAGEGRYAALGLHDKSEAGRLELLRRNLRFFGAPVGLFFTIGRDMGAAQWTDLGMYMQAVMLMAREEGLDTCPQAVWSNWPRLVGAFLGLTGDEMLVAGMALGRRDPLDPLCAVATARASLEEFVAFHDT